MDDGRFDAVIRALGNGATRRGALGLLAGAAGLTIGEAVAKRRKRRRGGVRAQAAKADKVTICHATSSETNPYEIISISENGWLNGHTKHEHDSLRGNCCVDDDCDEPDDRCFVSECQVVGQGTNRKSKCVEVLRDECNCTEWILSGGEDPTDQLRADDELRIELNGAPILADEDCLADDIAPVTFTAKVGDQVRVIATDCAFCRSLSALWLHCPASGLSRELFSGRDDGCDVNRPTGVFFDETFTIEL
jgi:hypothetical protein